MELSHCPQRDLDRDTGELLLLAKLNERGLPPIAGGALDQSHWFLEACAMLWGEQSRIKNELGCVSDG